MLVEERLLRDSRGAVRGIRSTLQGISERKQVEQTLSEYAGRLRLLTLDAQSAEERERRRVSEYIHDRLGQVLAAVRAEIHCVEEHETFA